MKRFHSMLMLFVSNQEVSRFRLEHSFPKELIDEAEKEGLIIEIRRNSYGESVYVITNAGRKYRDE